MLEWPIISCITFGFHPVLPGAANASVLPGAATQRHAAWLRTGAWSSRGQEEMDLLQRARTSAGRGSDPRSRGAADAAEPAQGGAGASRVSCRAAAKPRKPGVCRSLSDPPCRGELRILRGGSSSLRTCRASQAEARHVLS